jgi:hypothetical protein
VVTSAGVPHLRNPLWIHLFHGLEVCEGLDFTQNCFQDQCAPVDQSSFGLAMAMMTLFLDLGLKVPP